MPAYLRRFLLPLVGALLGCKATAALAAPWVPVGDRRLREDLELLQDAGVLQGTTSVWPLPWAGVGQSLDLIDDSALKPMHHDALRRVRQTWSSSSTDELSLSATVRAASEPAFRRDFSDLARDEADVSVAASAGYGAVQFNLQVGYLRTPQGRDYNFDGTYAAAAIGNWGVYAGMLEQWWGPSHESSLVLSNSARPFPKFGITRLAAEPFKTRWLSWLGPWRFDGFVGQLTGPRSDPFKKPLVLGLRGTIQPARGLEIGVSRLLQLCGSGRPCSVSTFTKALVPIGQSDNTGTFNEPGNQALSVDVRYGRPVGQVQASVYAQVFAEDTLLEVASFQLGGSVSGQAKAGTWRVGIEAVDTYARIFSKPGSGSRQGRATYLHFIYLDGLAYRGAALGHSLDGDAQSITGTASLTDKRNRRWALSLTRADLNRFSTPLYRVSQNREKLWLGEARVDWPTRIGDIGADIRLQSDTPNTPGRKASRINAGLRWAVRF